MLEIEKLYSRPETTIQIGLPHLSNSRDTVFLWTGQFSIGGSAEFTTPYDSVRAQKLKEFSVMASEIFSEVASAVGGDKLQKLSEYVNKGVLTSVNQTVAMFSGYKKPVFTVVLVDIAYKPNMNPIKRLTPLLKAVFPEVATSVTVSKPFNYTTRISGGEIFAENAVSVRIARFFEAHNWMIIRDVQLSFSNETTDTGFPLYGTAQVTFEPYKLPSYKDVLSWFKFE